MRNAECGMPTALDDMQAVGWIFGKKRPNFGEKWKKKFIIFMQGA